MFFIAEIKEFIFVVLFCTSSKLLQMPAFSFYALFAVYPKTKIKHKRPSKCVGRSLSKCEFRTLKELYWVINAKIAIKFWTSKSKSFSPQRLGKDNDILDSWGGSLNLLLAYRSILPCLGAFYRMQLSAFRVYKGEANVRFYCACFQMDAKTTSGNLKSLGLVTVFTLLHETIRKYLQEPKWSKTFRLAYQTIIMHQPSLPV